MGTWAGSERRDYGSFADFSDPDGNSWVLQEVRRGEPGSMTGTIANRSVPGATVTPVLAYVDVGEAADWLCNAFGLTVRLLIGDHRAQLVYGDGAVIVTQGNTGPGHAATHSVHVRVEDAAAHHEQAAAAGATILNPPTDYPYGERQYTAEDPGGHRWTFSQSIADVDPASWGGELVAEPQ
ncbi:MAG TPA: VOC family protein [Gaiellaceae bacterium]|nr:VOC family protein [Gaiellaceae bacterium]